MALPLRSTGTASCSTTAWTSPRDQEFSEKCSWHQSFPPRRNRLESQPEQIHLTDENYLGLNSATTAAVVDRVEAAAFLSTIHSFGLKLCRRTVPTRAVRPH